MGVDRVAMNRYGGIPNIRLLFENDERLLRQVQGLMLEFSLSWLADYVDLPADPRGAGPAADRRRPGRRGDRGRTAGDTRARRRRHHQPAGLHEPLRSGPRDRGDLRPAAPAARRRAGGAAPSEPRDAARVAVEDAEGCPRLRARVVRGVKIGPSPDWLRRRLESIGLRSINNVVDVTNFILWELGQPLHAYDLAKLAGRRDRGAPGARRARRLTTLDGVERELDPEMLVIADAERPVGLGRRDGRARQRGHGRHPRHPDRGRPLRPPAGARRRPAGSACTPTPATASSAAPTRRSAPRRWAAPRR